MLSSLKLIKNSHKVAILDLCIPLFDTTQSITCNWMRVNKIIQVLTHNLIPLLLCSLNQAVSYGIYPCFTSEFIIVIIVIIDPCPYH